MIYAYNKEALTFKKLPLTAILLTLAIIISILSLTMAFMLRESITIFEEAAVIYVTGNECSQEFSPEKLEEYIYSLNLKYPHIVLAQAKIESAHFKSEVFMENNNLFGMRQAKLRPTTSIGTNLNHAVYTDWRSSVQDYALYQASYLREIDTEEEYYSYLQANYAENPEYVNLIKQIVERKK